MTEVKYEMKIHCEALKVQTSLEQNMYFLTKAVFRYSVFPLVHSREPFYITSLVGMYYQNGLQYI